MGRTPFADIQAWLAAEVRNRFPGAEPVHAYGMDGWRIPRRRRVEWTHGTVDPNFILLALADRKRATTLHLWNPLDWKCLGRRRAPLEAAGFKVMVGCLQFTRQKPYPVDAVAALLDQVQADMASDAGQTWPYRTPRPKARAPSRAKPPSGTRGRATGKGAKTAPKVARERRKPAKRGAAGARP